jgi:PAS domain S-box-containing protein
MGLKNSIHLLPDTSAGTGAPQVAWWERLPPSGHPAIKRRAWRYLPLTTIAAALLLIALLTFVTRDSDPVIHAISRYLWLLPIMAAGYFYGQNVALLISFTTTSIHLPLLVQLYSMTGLSPVTIELGALVLFHNLFALLVPGMVDVERRQRKLLDTVERLGQVIENSRDLRALLPVVAQHSIQLCDADGGQVVMIGEGEETLTATVDLSPEGEGGAVCLQGSIHGTVVQWLLEQNDVVMLSNITHDPRFAMPPEENMRQLSVLAVPLRHGSQTTGVLALWRYGGKRFRREEADLLRILADKSQMAIENARLYARTDEALARQTRELSLLLEASTAFSATWSRQKILDILCRKMVALVEVTSCRIYLRDGEGHGMRCLASHAIRPGGSPRVEHNSMSMPSLRLVSEVLQSGQPQVVRSGDSALDLDEAGRAFLFPGETRSVLVMPLALKVGVAGIVLLGEERTWQRMPLTLEKVELCQALAQQGALALENLGAFEAIERQRERTQLIVDNVADGIVTTDLEGRIVAFNQAAERITGFPAAEVLGQKCASILRGLNESCERQCGTAECPLHLIQMGEYEALPLRCRETITRRDGTRVAISHSAAPLVERNGTVRVVGAVSVIRDVSREEELVRLKTEFISLVSHQLRTPLTNISGSAELLARGDLDETTQAEMLGTLNRQASRLSRLVNQVLQASRLETGQVQPVHEPLALIPLVEQTVRLFQTQYSTYDFQIERSLGVVFALGDQASVEVILDNLLQNAIHYSPEGSQIRVRVKEEASAVLVSVTDEGVGIPPEQVEGLFQRFHRLPGEGTQRPLGFGLGLYIVRMLVEALGGSAGVTSHPGKGSCFFFRLQKLEDLDAAGTGDR